MPPEGTEVEAEREPSERAPGVARAVPPRPFVGEMRQLCLMRILVPASAVLVAGRRCRVVIAGNTLDAILLQKRDRLVGTGGVAHQVTEVEGRVDARATGDVGEHRAQGRQVGVDVGNQCVTHDIRLIVVREFTCRRWDGIVLVVFDPPDRLPRASTHLAL